MKTASLLGVLALLCISAAPLAAQQAPDAGSVASRARGVDRIDGVTTAIGPRYHAEIHADRVVYIPALGSAAESTSPWTASAATIAREGGAEVALSGGVVQFSEQRADVHFAGGASASYETRADGLEQSFTLAERPHGDGDLVVRQRIDTAWPLLSVDAATGVEWGSPDRGGVRVGAVTAIDARGATIAGSLAFADGILEYRVPAAFVDAAAFPLLVDPLIGSQFFVGGDTGNSLFDVQPKISYDASNGLYLVVWKRVMSAQSTQVYAIRINSSGQFLGAPIHVSQGSAAEIGEALDVANCNAVNAWVVAWVREFSYLPLGTALGLTFRAIPAFPTPIQPGPLYSLTGATQAYFAVALSNQRGTGMFDNTLIAAYAQGGVLIPSQITGRRLDVFNDMSIAFGNDVTLHVYDDSTDSIEEIALSRSGGAYARYLMAFTIKSIASGDRDIRVRVVDEDLSVQTGAFAIAESSALDERDPTVDGNGAEWFVAWEQSSLGSSDSSIYARRVNYTGAMKIDPAHVISAVAGVAEADPAIGYTGETWMLAWSKPNTSTTDDVLVAALNEVTVTSCGPPMTISNATLDLRAPGLATKYASGVSSDDGLVVFEGTTGGFAATDIYGQALETENGLASDIGGGCGLFSGQANAGCTVSSLTSLPLSLRNAVSGVPAFLFLSVNDLGFSEGGCTLHADPFSGFLIAAGNTNALGEKDYSLPLSPTPTLVGLQFYSQWGTYLGAIGSFTIGGTPTGLNLSTAVLARFQ
ncbi:MAG: hypothetical protein EPO68_07240 [Planctomycetota bacterium]|nr:MAG: hypothetical protein EPO68_07240 [Planctomycetota bacterium]